MYIFRSIFSLGMRRNPRPIADSAVSRCDMPPRASTSTPTPADPNPKLDRVPTSSPLSSVDSFATPTATSPNDIEEEDIIRTDDEDEENSEEDEEDEDEEDEDDKDEEDDEDEEDDGDPSDTDAPSQYYHEARGLPPELKEHCRVYLEEALPRQAISLLVNLLSNRRSNLCKPTYCPPPSQISLLCSIIVHPDFTTRPKEPDWPEISLQSLVYLRDLLAVFGPINAGFKEAVLFGINATPDLDPESCAAHDDSPGADERGLVRLSPRYGNDTIWQRGRDFFGVVGWAFTCSVLCLERWRWWSRWLDFMLDLLEKDVEERYRLDTENTSDEMSMMRGSILASYITQRSGRTTDAIMWIIKALFADGNTPSNSVFQEVWHREHKSKSQRASNKRKREKVNTDKGDYGGYLDDESIRSSLPSEPPTPQKNRMKPAGAEDEVLESAYVETIPLRQRLFSLVSYLCYGLGDTSLIDFSNLYEKFEQRIKELPLPVFSSFINYSTSALRIDQQIEILQGVLFLFVPSSAPSPRKVDRVCFEEGGTSPAILEQCFLPYPANTIEAEDNAKMSLLLENLLMIIWRHGESGGGFSEHLGEAVRQGVEARREKVNRKKTRGRGKVVSDAEIQARTVLQASDVRLGWLADAIAQDIEDDAMGEGECQRDRIGAS